MEAPTKAELKKLKVVELRQKLAEFGESQSGNRTHAHQQTDLAIDSMSKGAFAYTFYMI